MHITIGSCVSLSLNCLILERILLAQPSQMMNSLASVIFLTTSNLVFLFPICLALYRRWYIESLIYFYNMFFSTVRINYAQSIREARCSFYFIYFFILFYVVVLQFYHACDQEHYSFCLFNHNGLQLADFVGSYTSFVATMLSMSEIARSWKVFALFAGLLASLTLNLYDRFSKIGMAIFLLVAITFTVGTWVRFNLTLFCPIIFLVFAVKNYLRYAQHLSFCSDQKMLDSQASVSELSDSNSVILTRWHARFYWDYNLYFFPETQLLGASFIVASSLK